MDVLGCLAQPIVIFFGSHLELVVTCVVEGGLLSSAVVSGDIVFVLVFRLIPSFASSVVAPGSWRQIPLRLFSFHPNVSDFLFTQCFHNALSHHVLNM